MRVNARSQCCNLYLRVYFVIWIILKCGYGWTLSKRSTATSKEIWHLFKNNNQNFLFILSNYSDCTVRHNGTNDYQIVYMDHVFGTYRIQKIPLPEINTNICWKNIIVHKTVLFLSWFSVQKFSFSTTPLLHQDIHLETPELLPEKEKGSFNQRKRSWWWLH